MWGGIFKVRTCAILMKGNNKGSATGKRKPGPEISCLTSERCGENCRDAVVTSGEESRGSSASKWLAYLRRPCNVHSTRAKQPHVDHNTHTTKPRAADPRPSAAAATIAPPYDAPVTKSPSPLLRAVCLPIRFVEQPEASPSNKTFTETRLPLENPSRAPLPAVSMGAPPQ
jgi:hypothetical protein